MAYMNDESSGLSLEELKAKLAELNEMKKPSLQDSIDSLVNSSNSGANAVANVPTQKINEANQIANKESEYHFPSGEESVDTRQIARQLPNSTPIGLNLNQLQSLSDNERYSDPREYRAANLTEVGLPKTVVTPPSSKTSSVKKTSDDAPSVSQQSEPSALMKAFLENQQRANNMEILDRGAQAATDTIAAMTGQKENIFTKGIQSNLERDSKIPDKFTKMIEMQKNDPNSDISKAYQQMAAKLGMPNPQGASAAQLDPYISHAGRIMELKEASANRLQMAKQHQEAMQLQRDLAMQEKWNGAVDKTITSVAKAIDPLIASNRQEYGKAANRYSAIQRVKQLMHGGVGAKELDNMSESEVFEVNLALASLASAGGVPSQYATRHVDRDSALRNIKKFQQWITNQPVGAAQGAQMQRALGNLNAQEKVAQDSMVTSQKRALAPLFKIYFDPKTSEQHKTAIQSMLLTAKLPIDTMERLSDDLQSTKNHKAILKEETNPTASLPQAEKQAPVKVSDHTQNLINSRTDEENRKRLQELEAKYKR